MAGSNEAFRAHLAGGVTTLCRCWALVRRDGQRFGFTDHDRDLAFGGFAFRADTGLSALALQQGTGLAVDNSEAVGVLSDAAVRDADIEAGRFDGAEVLLWLVNWTEVSQRQLLFRGSLGEVRRAGGAFRAELRGLTEALNRPVGRVYQAPCSAVLGDARCRVDLSQAGYRAELPVEAVEDGRLFRWAELPGFDEGWFARGRLAVLSGVAEGLAGTVKGDRFEDGARVIELWEPLRAAVVPGDRVLIEAGCDKRFETCRLKFLNAVNFQGFPDIPGEDWMVAVPRSSGSNNGGSRR